MKALVVYDSKYGNTKQIAHAVAETLGGPAESLAMHVRDVTSEDLTEVTLLVIGSPTHAWGPTSAIKAFLAKLLPEAMSGLRAAAFDTGFHMPLTGFAAGKIENALTARGGQIAAPAQRFWVIGMRGPLVSSELARAADWARQMIEDSRANPESQ